MIFDNIKDIYIFKDIIDIIENSDMLFLRSMFFENNTLPLKSVKSDFFLYNEMNFFYKYYK